MGLDITAYSHLVPFDGEIPVNQHGDRDWDWIEENDLIHAFAYPGFEQSTRGLRDHDVVDAKGELITNSWYQKTAETETHGFRAGSYSGYGEFRDMLAKLVGYESASAVWRHPTPLVGLPFYELLNFADNEGTIGPEAAKDLLEDFQQFRDKWIALIDSDIEESWYLAKYEDWIKAFELASDNGLVDFH